MSKKKPTKKEIEVVVSDMINQLSYIDQKLSALDSLFGLYIDWKKEMQEFNDFIKIKTNKADKELKENEPGETK